MTATWRRPALTGLAVACLGVTACGHTAPALDPARRQLVEGQLRARHADLLVRDPPAVAEVLARMARSSFAYFRGNIGLLADQPSRFVTAATAQVAVIGDPHPENIGTFRTPRGERVVDFNDFDLAGHGPYVRDLRRLALGLWLTADIADLGRRPRGRTIEALVDGYRQELQGLSRGAAPVSLRADSAFGGDLSALLAEPDAPDFSQAATAAVSPEQRELVLAALAGYPRTLFDPGAVAAAAFAPKQVARTTAGIASLRLLRFRVRVEGPTASEDDDWVLELKESETGSAERLVRLQREIQEFPDEDPLLGWATVGGRSFRVRGVSADQRRLSVDRINKRLKSPAWGKRHLRELAFQCGRLLARGHARARTADGSPGLSALAAAVGDGRGLTAETVEVTARAAATVEADLDHLRALLKDRGPLLGWR
jgi:hypothetical protein